LYWSFVALRNWAPSPRRFWPRWSHYSQFSNTWFAFGVFYKFS